MCCSSISFFPLRGLRAILCSIGFLASLFSAKAQVSVVNFGATGTQVNLGATYTQSFDSLANTNTSPVPWVNNGTLPGWYAYRQSSGAVTVYNPSGGGAPDYGSFGALGNADRALGSSLNGGQADVLHFGVLAYQAVQPLGDPILWHLAIRYSTPGKVACRSLPAGPR